MKGMLKLRRDYKGCLLAKSISGSWFLILFVFVCNQRNLFEIVEILGGSVAVIRK